MAHQAGVIKVAPLLDSNQVRNLRRQEDAGIAARGHTGWDRFAGCDEIIERHRSRLPVWVVCHPWHLKLTREAANPCQPFCRIAELSGSAKHRRALTIIRVVPLCAGSNASIRHDSRVAGIAAHGAQLNLALSPDDPTRERNHAVAADRHPEPIVELPVVPSTALKNTGAYEVGALNTSSPALIQSSRVFSFEPSKAISGSCRRSHSV